ncbi:hypothetical protein C0Q70_05169 [Pomacea canaliculata]|uniref:Sulfatase N-terminal domain-containing protein n=1 Tax=Pomacea canaliculata TaxID=400727 RepID=A0A2T7PKJ9_POMCA|nr:hypothetical protein C0Q70_05169 [Pomacea canaliculata]
MYDYSAAGQTVGPKPPNIVFVLTDDQDLVLGGMDPMQKTTNLIGQQGLTFTNAVVSCPICCPSRSSIISGKYIHNHGAINNSVEGGCSSRSWQQNQETRGFPVYLKQRGYTTFFAGKYLNQYGYDRVGGVSHVPPGWDWWNGLVGNSKYYDYQISINGTLETHGHDYLNDYLTDLINRRAQDFLELQGPSSPPFFLMLSTPACHEPFPSAPHYAHRYSAAKAPRDHGSFNVKAKDKHWLMEQPIIPMPNDTLQLVDEYYSSRLRTLLSVDDMVEDVYNTLRRKNLLDNTYILFASDNGYHLGQFGLPYDKREPYEFDIRVPMMIRGPGIAAGTTSQESAMNIDLGPTFISLAGGEVPDHMDGKPLTPLWENPKASQNFRPNVLVEYSGEEKVSIAGCPQWQNQRLFNCNPLAHCVCEDAWNNTFSCIRATVDSAIYKYCEFKDNQNFVELYELISDPFELTNLASTAAPNLKETLKQQLALLTSCSGSTCNTKKIKHKKMKKAGGGGGGGRGREDKKMKGSPKLAKGKDTVVKFSQKGTAGLPSSQCQNPDAEETEEEICLRN